ncbi:MAG: adenylate/guanylate cyclase domain-containing protein [Pseudomonadota bacterium]
MARLARWVWGIGAALTACLILLYLLAPLPVRQMQNAVFDGYQRLSPRIGDATAPLQIIDIDEASLAALGQWPWPRTYLADMTDRLYAAGALIVAFDVLLSEPDRTSPQAVARSWTRFNPDAALPEALQALPDHDTVFADAIARGPTVLAIAGGGQAGVASPLAGVSYTGDAPLRALPRFAGALPPLPMLRDAASGLGSVSLVPGADGVTRSVPMAVWLDDQIYPSFAAEILRVAQGAGSHILRTTQASGEVSGGTVQATAMRVGRAEVPLDGDGAFRVHFAEPLAARITPAAQVLGADDPDALAAQVAGKIVLVGSSAQALFDIRLTPLGTQVPGVVVQAQVLEQVLNGQFLTRPDWMPGLEIALIALFGVVLTFLAARDRTMLASLALLLMSLTLWAGGWLAFERAGVLFDPSMAVLAGVVIYLPGATMNVVAGRRARAGIRQQFASFVPDALLTQITADPEAALTPDGSERDMTVMFVDMKGFSTVTERMQPEEVVNLLNTFLTAISRAIMGTGGTIDKYIGDAVMAFWNAPLTRADHIRCGLEAVDAVSRAVAQANGRLAEMGLPQVEARIGVNTGPAFVGLMGSTDRLSYSCVGDSVTLAARLEGATRIYGTTHLVGAATLANVPAGWRAVTIDTVVVKGRSQGEPVSVLLPAADPATEAFARHVAAVLDAQAHGDWSDAAAAAQALEGVRVPGCDTAVLVAFYRDRSQALSDAQQVLAPGGHVAQAKR